MHSHRAQTLDRGREVARAGSAQLSQSWQPDGVSCIRSKGYPGPAARGARFVAGGAPGYCEGASKGGRASRGGKEKSYSYTGGQRLVIGISRPGKSSGMVRVSPSCRVVTWKMGSPLPTFLLSPRSDRRRGYVYEDQRECLL